MEDKLQREYYFDNEINAQNHIIILCSEENGKYWQVLKDSFNTCLIIS